MTTRTLKLKLTRKQFQEKADQILGRLFREVSAFEDTSEAAKAARRERGRTDHFYFFQTYLPHYFSAPSAPFHHEMIATVDRRPGPGEVVIPAVEADPRDFAKSTIVSFGYSLHQICHARRHFILLGSDTEDLASDLTGYIYLELLYNERIKCDFGELVRDNWAVDDFVALNDVRVKARGRGQRVRGLKHKNWRPDLVILDDMENDQNVRNPELVRKLLSWITGTVYPAIEADGSLLWVGTVLARKSALYIAIHSDEEPYCHWRRKLRQAIQEDGTSLWPARHPIEKLLGQKKAMGSLAFNREKMNDPVDEDGAIREAWLRYYNRFEIVLPPMIVASFVDPSAKNSEVNDYKAIITVGLEREKMLYRCLHAWIRRASIGEMFAASYRQQATYGGLVGIEENMLKDFLHESIDNYALTVGHYLPWKPIDHKASKESRIIGTLSYLVEHGKLLFEKGQSDQNILVEQLIYYPSKLIHDDGPDALEGAVSLLQRGGGPVVYESLGRRRFAEQRGAW
jgi:hypothetical protein